MPARRPRPQVSLEAFLRGFVAALALKQRPRFRADAGVLDRALAGTVRDCAKAAERVRIEFAFRLREDALSAEAPALRRALDALEREGILRPPGAGENEYEILLDKRDAVAILTDLDLPIPLFERASNAFRRRQEMAKIRALVRRRP